MPTKVCVTGACGFIGSYLVKALLDKGYQVVGAVRDASQEKIEHLKSLSNASSLQIMSIDLLTAYTLESAFSGCDAVFHLAAPTKLPDQVVDHKRELMTPIIEGTCNVLDACVQAGVNKVILTSSTAAVVGSEKPPKHIWTEADWSEQANLSERQAWYPLAKLLAEEAAWDFVEKKKPKFTLATIQPTMCVGPMMQPYLNASNELLLRYMNGTKKKVPRSCMSFIDVRDCADGHILVYEKSSPGRHLLVGGVLTFDHVCSILRRAVPSGQVPTTMSSGNQEPLAKYDVGKIQRLGLSCRSVVQTLVETVSVFQQAGYINDKGEPIQNDGIPRQQPEKSNNNNTVTNKGAKAGVDNSNKDNKALAVAELKPGIRPSYMQHDVSDVRVTESELKELFNTFDQDNNGYISKNEFKSFYYNMDQMGLTEEEAQVDQMLSKYSSVDGEADRLSFDEFCIVMLKLAQR